MARGRMISKSLSTSRKYAALTAEAGELGEFCQALFPLIVAHADDFGRLPGDVFTIRYLVLPTSTRTLEQFNAALSALDHVGLIQRYHVDGGDYIQVIHFDEHQVGLSRRSTSKHPQPPDRAVKMQEVHATSQQPHEVHAAPAVVQELHSQLNRTELNLTEQNLTEQNVNCAPRARAPVALAGMLPRDHIRHAWCSDRGKCVPDFLHAQFQASVGGETRAADQRLKAFYEAVQAGWPDGPIGDDPVKLWRKEFAAKFPSVAPVHSQRAGLSRVTESALRAIREAGD